MATPKYYCHTCKAEITPVLGKEELTCPMCNSEFVEEIDIDDPPTRPPSASSTISLHPHSHPHTQNPPILPQIIIPFGPSNELLPLAQTFHQLIRMHNNNNNNNNNNSNNITNNSNNSRTFTFQAGPMAPNNFMLNILQSVLPAGGPQVLAGNPGDYVFGGNFEQILNQLFQNANHTGNPPAAQSAVEQLNKGKINEVQIENKLDCAICKEEFTPESEYIEMPCKHIFDKECILQWLAIHNSCPVCRFELKTDSPDYESRRS